MPNTPGETKSDSPLANTTLSKLGKVEAGGPYVYVCKNGKDEVTFPDLADMDWLEGEQFLQDMANKKESDWMKKWLSEEDYECFVAENLKMRQMVPIIKDVFTYYQELFGTEGED